MHGNCRALALGMALASGIAMALPSASAASGAENRLAMPVPPGFRRIDVKPSATDPRIAAFDHDHRVVYAPGADAGKLLVFLVGTTEKATVGPQEFFRTALDQGYRVVSLSYISFPAGAQICVRERLRADPDCAAHFRQRRLYGDIAFDAIPDQPHDAIVPRLTKLLEYLARTDPEGHWDRYLDGARPDWTRIAVSGQSQGGGMAQYLGKRETLARVLSFSGGWDMSGRERIASWYATPATTPKDRWYYAYHVREPMADRLRRIGDALALPDGHVLALDLPLDGKARRARQPGHGSAVGDTAYRDVWIRMLGSGKD